MPENDKQNVNNDDLEAKIKENKEKYEEIVNRLYENDEEEWVKIYKNVVLVALRFPSPWGDCQGKIAWKIDLSPADIYLKLKYLMIDPKRNKLAKYRYECGLYAWMRYFVVRIVQDYDRKVHPPKQDDDQETSKKKRKPVVQTVDPHTMAEVTAAPIEEIEKENEAKEKRLALCKPLENAVIKLYRTNPREAAILILHGQERLSYKAICCILGLPQTDIKSLENKFECACRKIKSYC